jgi:NAD(P)-dependent dehydrogenase (short-subunit alcohol dehydrogenase family)
MQSVLITGASTGIGHATALHLNHLGYEVYATIRRPADAANLPAPIRPIILDLHDAATIAALPRQLPPTLYALINNAGHNYISPFEHSTDPASRALMETNFFGLATLTRTLLPHLRAWHLAHPGQTARLVNISSIGGLIGIPWEPFYHASKFAVVGLTESLRHELWREGIRASVVCPGGIRTPFIPKTVDALSAVQTDNPRYLSSLARFRDLAAQATRFGSPPLAVAEAIASLLSSHNPPFRRLVGPDAHLMLALARLLPTRLFHTLMRATFTAA